MPVEITSILKQRIEQYDVETDLAEVGTVLQVGDGIARAYGLENAVAMEMLELEHGVVGLAFNLEEDDVGAALFGEWEHIKEGQPVRRTAHVADVPVGEALLGLGRHADAEPRRQPSPEFPQDGEADALRVLEATHPENPEATTMSKRFVRYRPGSTRRFAVCRWRPGRRRTSRPDGRRGADR